MIFCANFTCDSIFKFGRCLGISTLLLVLTGCAGYHSYSNSNPFQKYKINSISIPMFVNKSIIPNLNTKVMQSVSKVLLAYSKLKVSFGENYDSDAFLIGVISSGNRFRDVFTAQADTFVDGPLKSSIGNRKAFYVPTQTSYQYKVMLYLIKNPAQIDLELIKSNISSQIKGKHSKIVYSKTIEVTSKYDRPLKNPASNDDAGIVNFTQAQGNMNDSLLTSATNVANQFKQMIINDFL